MQIAIEALQQLVKALKSNLTTVRFAPISALGTDANIQRTAEYWRKTKLIINCARIGTLRLHLS
jgi:hypothetical protein